MSTGLRKMVVHTITGATYISTYTSAQVAEIEAEEKGGVKGMVHRLAVVLGRASDRGADLKIHTANIGWVALNPNHVVAVEFHGTEDVT